MSMSENQPATAAELPDAAQTVETAEIDEMLGSRPGEGGGTAEMGEMARSAEATDTVDAPEDVEATEPALETPERAEAVEATESTPETSEPAPEAPEPRAGEEEVAVSAEGPTRDEGDVAESQEPQSVPATTTVAAALADAIARAGIKIAFTVPGETVLSLLGSLAERHVRVVAARHEGAASFMAAAVGQLTGRPALCVANRGPGAANLAIGLHAARADSAPVVAIVGQVRRDLRGHEAFQEMDLVAAFEPLVKWVGEVKEPAEAVPMLEKALAAATRGRPGPVMLSIPADTLDLDVSEDATTHAVHPEHHADPDPVLVRKVLHLIADARRPVILAGAGVLRARSTDALVKFAETLQVPVIAAWRRADVFPNDNPLYLGMAGNGAPETVLRRLEEADAILVIGSRLGEVSTFGYAVPAPGSRWAQIDVEPHSAGAPSRPDVVMASDAAAFLRVAQRVLVRAAFDVAALDARVAANRADRAAFEKASVVDGEDWEGPGIHPGRVVATLALALPAEAIITTDAGDFGTWAARGFRFHRPGTFLGSSAGPMGYGLPAAIGATLARPGRLGVALAGDGGFAMTMAELETAVRERAHVVALVFDNAKYGTILRHQERRGMAGGLATKLGHVDFAAVAVACGALGLTVRSDEEFEPALRQALDAGRPALLHLLLDPSWSTPEAALDRIGSEPTEEAEPAAEEPEG
jgi:acetolactate synthase-1/2/3 large subunit